MRIKINFSLLFIVIFLASSHLVQASCYTHNRLNFDTRHDRYEEIMYHLDRLSTTSLDMRIIMQQIDLLVKNVEFEETCIFNESYTVTETDPTFGPKLITFEWDDVVPENGHYFGYYMNLSNIIQGFEEETVTSLESFENKSLSFPISNVAGPHLFVINSRCEHGEKFSNYTIIIVERIAIISSGGGGSCLRSQSENPVSIESSSTNLNLYPNLVLGSDVVVEFELPEIQNITISIINGSTGVQEAIVIQNESYIEGLHRFRLPINDLPPGIHYVILQSPNQRIVKRMVKIRD